MMVVGQKKSKRRKKINLHRQEEKSTNPQQQSLLCQQHLSLVFSLSPWGSAEDPWFQGQVLGFWRQPAFEMYL
jgi:hypothetical protein